MEMHALTRTHTHIPSIHSEQSKEQNQTKKKLNHFAMNVHASLELLRCRPSPPRSCPIEHIYLEKFIEAEISSIV